VLVTRNLQPSLWDSVLPAEVRRLSPLLAQVDGWLDDERSSPRSGRISARCWAGRAFRWRPICG